ncbi:nucleoside-diphosphate kinase [Candidatus Poriferisodalis sp.]|uniref:nucleoside-diphosphate kinase n=1 Tax=Candidatus Poriferisodalis sp. TaxID=3101277 RepID=UPI003B52DECE
MRQTLVICKPDAVERGLVGEIVGRFERKGLAVAALEHRTIDRDTAERHYAEHAGKPFYEPLLEFITRSPSVVMVLEGPPDAGDDVFAVVRTMMGTTNPATAAPGTIRGDFGLSPTENLVHGSDSEASAEREIALFFPTIATTNNVASINEVSG